MEVYKDEVMQEKIMKPKLFNYPDWDSPVAVFDFEDLENTEAMLVLCVRKDETKEYREAHVCYVWKGPDSNALEWSESQEMNENDFVQKCIEQYWGAGNINSLDIRITNEPPDQPSDAFMHFFD